MSQLIDLDAVTREDIRLRLAGVEYTIPGELTVEQMLHWIKIQERWVENARAAERLEAGEDPGEVDAPEDLLVESKQAILDLFRERQADIADLPLKPSQIGVVFAALFGRYEEATEPDPTPPTRKPVRKPRS